TDRHRHRTEMARMGKYGRRVAGHDEIVAIEPITEEAFAHLLDKGERRRHGHRRSCAPIARRAQQRDRRAPAPVEPFAAEQPGPGKAAHAITATHAKDRTVVAMPP